MQDSCHISMPNVLSVELEIQCTEFSPVSLMLVRSQAPLAESAL